MNYSQPDHHYLPNVIRFLGYDPTPEGVTLAERLLRRRTALGLSQKEAAGRIGVDAGTLAKYERGERKPEGEFAARVEGFLGARMAVTASARTA